MEIQTQSMLPEDQSLVDTGQAESLCYCPCWLSSDCPVFHLRCETSIVATRSVILTIFCMARGSSAVVTPCLGEYMGVQEP